MLTRPMSAAAHNDAGLAGESLSGNRDAFGQIVAPTWERWRLTGGLRDETFPTSTHRWDGSAPRITTVKR